MKMYERGVLALSKANFRKLLENDAKHDEWLETNRARISTVAYTKAEARGFEPGHELEDWLEAEEEVAQALKPHEFFV